MVSSSPGDHVGVGDDQAGRAGPARPLDPEAAGGAEHADHRGRRRAHLGVGGDRRVGRADGGRRAGRSCGAGSTRLSALRIGPEGGSTSLRLRRITDRWTSARSSRRRPARAGRPRRRPRRGRARRRRSAPRRRRRRRGASPAADHPRAQPEREALEPRPRPAPRPAARRARRRAARRATREPCSRTAGRAGCRAGAPSAEAGQGQRADDQALPVAPERERDGEGDDRPIEHGHGRNKSRRQGPLRHPAGRGENPRRGRRSQALPFMPVNRPPSDGAAPPPHTRDAAARRCRPGRLRRRRLRGRREPREGRGQALRRRLGVAGLRRHARRAQPGRARVDLGHRLRHRLPRRAGGGDPAGPRPGLAGGRRTAATWSSTRSGSAPSPSD